MKYPTPMHKPETKSKSFDINESNETDNMNILAKGLQDSTNTKLKNKQIPPEGYN